MITAHHDMDSTIRAMKGGAFDYIHKPINVDELDIAINKAVKTFEMEKKIDGLLMEPSRQFKVGDIIGSGKDMREIFKTIGVVSQSRTTVLIEGESGTGKELIAKVIHHNTAPDEPYIAINCSAIVETLLESELFGHEKGSFTGAISRKQGKFELARYGTVFLDEISEMSLNLQAKLLRVLQEMEFERVGGKDRVRVNARIVAATNKDLKTMVKENKFRDDLYYRLNIVSILIPPLRERREDIGPLVDYLLTKINKDLHKRVIGVSNEMMDVFMKYNWPGTIRELENLLVRALVVAKGQVLVRSDFPELIDEHPKKENQEDKANGMETSGKLLTLDEVEERYIRDILKKNSALNKGEVCDILGISRPTFERKLEKYGITFERE
jgi:two-component system response regulator AtoC